MARLRRVATLAALVIAGICLGSGRAPADPRPGFLGVVVDLSERGEVYVDEVMAESPAAAAGIAAGDVITAVDGNAILTPEQVVAAVMGAGAGARLRFELRRGDRAFGTVVVLDERPRIPRDPMSLEGHPAPAIHALQVLPRENPAGPATRGRVVVIDFWATWCRPCHVIMPVLAEWHRRFCPEGLTVLGISSERRSVVEGFVRRMHLPYAFGIDGGNRTAMGYGVVALPTMVVIDRRGEVRRVTIGADPIELGRTESLIQRLLREPPPTQ